MKIVNVQSSLKRHASLRYRVRDVSEIQIIAIHHSLTKTGSPQAFADYHVDTHGWPGIGYHYVIGKDGTVYVTQDERVVSYHVGDANREALGICLVGDFRSENPTKAQYKALLELIHSIQKRLPQAKVKGHSELPNYSWKECPVISMDKLRADLVVFEISDWAIEARAALMDKGITDGSRPRDPVTREEVWSMLHRMMKGGK